MSDSRNATLERELRDRAWLNEKELDLWEAELRRVQRNGDVILPPGSNCLVRMARHALESMQSEKTLTNDQIENVTRRMFSAANPVAVLKSFLKEGK